MILASFMALFGGGILVYGVAWGRSAEAEARVEADAHPAGQGVSAPARVDAPPASRL